MDVGGIETGAMYPYSSQVYMYTIYISHAVLASFQLPRLLSLAV